MCLYSLVKHRCCENCQEVYSIAHQGLNTEGQMHCSSQPNTSTAFPKRLETLQAELGNYSLLETSLSLQVEELKVGRVQLCGNAVALDVCDSC